MMLPRSMHQRLRISGIFVLLGLIVEASALRWSHPTAFLVFALVGAPLQMIGILTFLYSLVTVRSSGGDRSS
ncbi:MAG TPA: hypothetical protein VN684_08620 [Terriglobales bacterium]|nr:hypothetical protein [Terriglobales bacterium]